MALSAGRRLFLSLVPAPRHYYFKTAATFHAAPSCCCPAPPPPRAATPSMQDSGGGPCMPGYLHAAARPYRADVPPPPPPPPPLPGHDPPLRPAGGALLDSRLLKADEETEDDANRAPTARPAALPISCAAALTLLRARSVLMRCGCSTSVRAATRAAEKSAL